MSNLGLLCLTSSSRRAANFKKDKMVIFQKVLFKAVEFKHRKNPKIMTFSNFFIFSPQDMDI
jgi:hypothetical protein